MRRAGLTQACGHGNWEDRGPPPTMTEKSPEGFMKLRMLVASAIAVVASAGIQGCVHAPRDTAGFSQNQHLSVPAPFDTTWQAVKDTLREKELDIYTRDKRGVFVAYTSQKRRYLQPNRYQYTFDIEPISENETRIALETIKQSYGVTLLTYPGWHDRQTDDAPESQELLDAIQARLSAGAGQ